MSQLASIHNASTVFAARLPTGTLQYHKSLFREGRIFGHPFLFLEESKAG